LENPTLSYVVVLSWVEDGVPVTQVLGSFRDKERADVLSARSEFQRTKRGPYARLFIAEVEVL
jgi:hypothetical protein